MMPRRARAFYRDGRLWLQVLVGVEYGPVVTVFEWVGGPLADWQFVSGGL